MKKIFIILFLLCLATNAMLCTNAFAGTPHRPREIGSGEKVLTISIWVMAAITTVLAFTAVAHAGAPARTNSKNPIECAHHVEPKNDKEFLEHDCPCMPY